MFTILPASPADVPAAAAVLGEAFAHDVVMGSLVMGDHRPARFARLFTALMRAGALRTGLVDLARRDDDGVVLGAAIWEAPGRHASLLDQARELPDFVRALGAGGLRRALRLQSVLARHRPAEPHWYLAQIGVGRDARGTGVGGALLRSRLARIDSEEAPAYLESSNERNRALYQRLGFEVIGAIPGVPGAAPASMWRSGAAG